MLKWLLTVSRTGLGYATLLRCADHMGAIKAGVERRRYGSRRSFPLADGIRARAREADRATSRATAFFPSVSGPDGRPFQRQIGI